MGKRELFIALAFIVAGAIAYQLTAPEPKPNQTGFSFSRFWTNAKREIRGNQAQATLAIANALPLSKALDDLRLEGNFAELKIFGEDRADLSYDLNVQSNGPDRDAALAYAKQVVIKTDDLGRSLTLRISYPREGRQSASLVLHVPSRLGILVASANGFQATNVGSAHMDNVGGDVTLTKIAGAVSGLHRNGVLRVRGAGSAKLTLQRSRASFDEVAKGATLDVRDGECRLDAPGGPIDIDEVRAEVTVSNPAGPVAIRGTDGRVTLTSPHAESNVDVRRADVEVRISQAVPVTALTTDDTLRVMIEGSPRVSIDAVSSNGRVLAPDFDLSADTSDQESRLTHAFGGAGGARVSLRNLRGDIVLKHFRAAIVNPDRK